MSDCVPLPSCSLFTLQHLAEQPAVALCARVESSSYKESKISLAPSTLWSWGLQLRTLWRRDLFLLLLSTASVDMKGLLNYFVVYKVTWLLKARPGTL